MPSPHGGIMIAPGVTVPRHAIDISFTTSSGPGGQNVNKRSTRCVMRMSFAVAGLPPGVEARVRAAVPYLVTEGGDLLLDCDENRSQGQNEDGCWERLRAIIVANLKAPKVRRATKPSRGSKERRLTAKKTRSQIKSRRSERHD
ncbi:MAG: aminoacyl-tRNA hydrolase [Planctomycetes bacterium]|nr:aminoacyl-tRNA hydrolase [Planctomycetota bacterium]